MISVSEPIFVIRYQLVSRLDFDTHPNDGESDGEGNSKQDLNCFKLNQWLKY